MHLTRLNLLKNVPLGWDNLISIDASQHMNVQPTVIFHIHLFKVATYENSK